MGTGPHTPLLPFFALANNLEQVTNSLNSLVDRLARFEPLTVKCAGKAVRS